MLSDQTHASVEHTYCETPCTCIHRMKDYVGTGGLPYTPLAAYPLAMLSGKTNASQVQPPVKRHAPAFTDSSSRWRPGNVPCKSLAAYNLAMLGGQTYTSLATPASRHLNDFQAHLETRRSSMHPNGHVPSRNLEQSNVCLSNTPFSETQRTRIHLCCQIARHGKVREEFRAHKSPRTASQC